MCYSKEVQLTTAILILLATALYYWYYSQKYQKAHKPWLMQFLRFTTLTFVAIGLHQFFEFLSLVTHNQIVYKIGLIISISAVYFLLRSLEVLSNKKLHAHLGLALIAVVSIYIFTIPLQFGAASFYLRHYSAFAWAALWLFLFIYWHVCAFKVYSELKDRTSKRTLLLYLLALADLSFILSAFYVIAGYFLFSVNVCTDAPSIWCTFYVVQALVVPILLFRLPLAFRRSAKTGALSYRKMMVYGTISLGILILLILTLPFFRCLSWKLMVP